MRDIPWFWRLVWICAVITLGFFGLGKGNLVAIVSAIGLMALGMALCEHEH